MVSEYLPPFNTVVLYDIHAHVNQRIVSLWNKIEVLALQSSNYA